MMIVERRWFVRLALASVVGRALGAQESRPRKTLHNIAPDIRSDAWKFRELLSRLERGERTIIPDMQQLAKNIKRDAELALELLQQV